MNLFERTTDSITIVWCDDTLVSRGTILAIWTSSTEVFIERNFFVITWTLLACTGSTSIFVNLVSKWTCHSATWNLAICFRTCSNSHYCHRTENKDDCKTLHVKCYWLLYSYHDKSSHYLYEKTKSIEVCACVLIPLFSMKCHMTNAS